MRHRYHSFATEPSSNLHTIAALTVFGGCQTCVKGSASCRRSPTHPNYTAKLSPQTWIPSSRNNQTRIHLIRITRVVVLLCSPLWYNGTCVISVNQKNSMSYKYKYLYTGTKSTIGNLFQNACVLLRPQADDVLPSPFGGKALLLVHYLDHFDYGQIAPPKRDKLRLRCRKTKRSKERTSFALLN